MTGGGGAAHLPILAQSCQKTYPIQQNIMADGGDGRNAGYPVSMAAELGNLGPAKTRKRALTQRTQRNAERHRESREREKVVEE